MYPTSSSFQSDTYANIPNMSLAFTMYTTTFGNGDFVIQPATPGEVQAGFPTVPYLSLEAVLYTQMSSNPSTSQVNVTGGVASGEHQVGATTTSPDSTGTTRNSVGYSTNS
jgi:hypothetical protein